MRIPQEQIDKANETDLVEFLRSQGEEVQREGKNYRWGRHDSVMINGNRWIRNSNKKQKGYPIQFVETFFGLKFPDAVALLLGSAPVVRAAMPAQQKPKKQFCLPEKDSTNDSIIKYLTGRGVSLEVINYFISRGDLYQAKYHHNCVFVGRDPAGTARYCFMRGLHDWTDKEGKLHKYRNEPEGSDKRYNFARTGTNNKLCLFESCIDLLSFMTLFPESGSTHLLSCGGTGDDAFKQYVKDHPKINSVFCCFDADEAGKSATRYFMHTLPASFKVAGMTPTKYKDWNELLQNFGTVPKLYEIEQRKAI